MYLQKFRRTKATTKDRKHVRKHIWRYTFELSDQYEVQVQL